MVIIVKQIIIVGCGRMGGWFAERLASAGHRVLLYDSDVGRAARLARRVGGERVGSLSGLGGDGVVLLALPISEAGPVLGSATRMAVGRARFVEISAFKRPLVRYLRLARSRGHVVASIHPLFGPGQKDDRGTTTVHVARRSSEEDRLIRLILPNTRVVRMGVEEHDRAMLVALSLTHFAGLSAGVMLSRLPPPGVETKSLMALLTLVSVALGESESFYGDYAMRSPEAIRLFKSYAGLASRLARRLEKGTAFNDIARVRVVLERRHNLRRAYSSLYLLSRGDVGKTSNRRGPRR
jgi:prephenate dehydrogenase